MIEVESNREAWGTLAEDHYAHYRDALVGDEHRLNHYIQQELGCLSSKRVVHLQCNVGADTVLLAREAQWVTGVDFVPENVRYAEKLASDLGCTNVGFVESDVNGLLDVHGDTYDVVFTSEGFWAGCPIWQQAKTVSGLLNESGYLYLFDSHPFSLMFDEDGLSDDRYEIRYPYFGSAPDVEDAIGGYASDVKRGVQAYFWMHTISDIVNALIDAGMRIESINEYPESFFDAGSMRRSDKVGLYEYPHNQDRYPLSFSLRASRPAAL